MRLDNKVAVVTGGASGIGKGIAERFLEAGAQVAVFDIDGPGVRELASAHPGGRALPLCGDVASEHQVRAAVEEVVRQWGAIDILINNAGIELHGSVVEITPDEWDRQLDVNLKGAFLFSRCAISYMRQRDGAIVNISSVHAMVSWPGTVAYDVSKCGLIGLTRSVALDHGRDGIRVNALCPGYIHTPITDRWLDTVPDREAAMRRVLSLHPLGRIGTPRDVAEACLFLVSDAASFINGGWRSRVNASISIRTSSRVDTLNGSRHANMKELRFTAADGERRVAFAFDTKRKAILLVAGDKSGVGERRFYRGLIRKADDRFDAHLARLKKERR